MTTDLITKYRPTSLDQVFGHESVIRSLATVLEKGTSHAFIFTGPAGTGKTTLARIVASFVGCPPQNINEIDAASNSGIDDVRELQRVLMYKPFGSSMRAIIIDEAHGLSKQAWTAMLKSVEEPPADLYWIFCTTEASKIPGNIASRCTAFNLNPLKVEQIVELLTGIAAAEGFQTPPEVIQLLAQKSNGSPRTGLANLAKAAHCTSRAEAVALLQTIDDDDDNNAGINLARALLKSISWADAMKLLAPILEQEVNAESVRMLVFNYVSAVVRKETKPERAAALLSVVGAFSQPYPTNSPNHLLISLGQCIFN